MWAIPHYNTEWCSDFGVSKGKFVLYYEKRENWFHTLIYDQGKSALWRIYQYIDIWLGGRYDLNINSKDLCWKKLIDYHYSVDLNLLILNLQPPMWDFVTSSSSSNTTKPQTRM